MRRITPGSSMSAMTRIGPLHLAQWLLDSPSRQQRTRRRFEGAVSGSGRHDEQA
jgi:hypothetical protein